MKINSNYRCVIRTALAFLLSAGVYGSAAGDVVRIEFNNLPYPDGHNVSNEWEAEGIVFSDDATGMDPNFPCVSLGWQENRVQSAVLWNLFRINFVADGPVVEVVCEFRDQNGRDQIHTLYELDENLNIVQQVEYDDVNGAEFSLRLSNPNGIFGIAACEQPYGAELFRAIEFTVLNCDPCDMNCDGAVNAFDIEPFLDLLFGPKPQPCDVCTGDTNGDGTVDAFDIEPFLECLFP